jgi:hypothetical protein
VRETQGEEERGNYLFNVSIGCKSKPLVPCGSSLSPPMQYIAPPFFFPSPLCTLLACTLELLLGEEVLSGLEGRASEVCRLGGGGGVGQLVGRERTKARGNTLVQPVRHGKGSGGGPDNGVVVDSPRMGGGRWEAGEHSLMSEKTR